MGKSSSETQETPQQAALVEKAQAQLADYKARWLPLQKNMAQQIQDMGAENSGARQRAQGRAAVESTVKFGQARAGVEKALSNQGRGPGSSAFKLGLGDLANNQAASKAGGMAMADQAVDNAYVQGLTALTAIGRGEKASAIQGETQLAAMSGRQAAADADEAAAAAAGNAQLIGTVGGMGLNAAMKPSSSNVPQSTLNRANNSADPLGSLNSQMGWTN